MCGSLCKDKDHCTLPFPQPPGGTTPKLWRGCSAGALHRLPWIWQKNLIFLPCLLICMILYPCIWQTLNCSTLFHYLRKAANTRDTYLLMSWSNKDQWCRSNKDQRCLHPTAKWIACLWQKVEKSYPVQRIIPVYSIYGGTPRAPPPGLKWNLSPVCTWSICLIW